MLSKYSNLKVYKRERKENSLDKREKNPISFSFLFTRQMSRIKSIRKRKGKRKDKCMKGMKFKSSFI